MTPSQLKAKVTATGNTFFSHSSMKFFGDTMTNYGCRQATVSTLENRSIACWELWRKSPVKSGFTGSVYFCCKTFDRIFPRKAHR